MLQVTCLGSGGANDSLGNGSRTMARPAWLLPGGGTLQFAGQSGVTNTNRLFTLSDGGGTIDASGTGAVNFTNGGAMGISAVGSVTLTLAGSNAGAQYAGGGYQR